MDQPFHYYEFDPAPALVRHVTSYWSFRVRAGEPATHRIWPDGCISLVWMLPAQSAPAEARPSAVLAGPRLRALDVPVSPDTVYWGARFWPDAGGPVIGIGAPELRELTVLAPARLQAGLLELHGAGRQAPEAEVAAALDAMLLPLVRAAPALDDAVRRAVLALVAARGDAAVATVAAQIGLGERQLQRRFRATVGLTLKQFARVRRLREAAAGMLEAGPPGWAAVAADFGFADQSHLIHEFSQLTGLTPVAFGDRLRRIEHGRVRP